MPLCSPHADTEVCFNFSFESFFLSGPMLILDKKKKRDIKYLDATKAGLLTFDTLFTRTLIGLVSQQLNKSVTSKSRDTQEPLNFDS